MWVFIVVVSSGWLVPCTTCMLDPETVVVAHLVGAPVKRVGFRGRLFAILLAFALVPSILIAVAWNATGSFVLPLVSGTAAWDSVAATGERAVTALRGANLSDAQRRALDAHEHVLRSSVVHSRQADFVFRPGREDDRAHDAHRRARDRASWRRASRDI